MTNWKLPLAATLSAALLLGGMAPASAATFSNGANLRAEINQLDRQIDVAKARHRIDPRAAARLDWQVRELRQDWHVFSRGGFTRSETRALDRKIDQVKAQMIRQRAAERGRDWRHDGERSYR